MTRVLVISDDDGVVQAVRDGLPDAAIDSSERLPTSGRDDVATVFDVVFIDAERLASQAPTDDHRQCLTRLWDIHPGARAVVMTAPSTIRLAVDLVREGASDYLTYPIHSDEVRLVWDRIERRERIRSELQYLRSLQSESLDPIRTSSEPMKQVLHKIRQVAPTRSTVLLTGETGTGKSLIARVIHANSNRRDRQFISVHCGAIPDTLLESELFGHERGAFTGAERRRLGKFELAHDGTLFLDEIATVTPAMQVKLLQVLQDRTIQRLGGEHNIEVDVRLVAASNNDLKALTENGQFRDDLFYRLNVFPIEVPPLREHIEDIPLLVSTFLERLSTIYQKQIKEVAPKVMESLTRYSWPGNVRELENLMERAVILENSRTLTPTSFPDELFADSSATNRVPISTDTDLATCRRRAADDAERRYLSELLARHAGRIDATASAAGITTRQLHKLMTKHRLKKEDFRHGPP
jgi:DNA-binding NtrC family response regulator